MHYCYVCGDVGTGVFTFPRDKQKLCQWLESLELRGKVTDQARICPEHFLPSDIIVSSNGRRLVREGAIPTKHVKRNAPYMDHNYARNSKNDDFVAFPWQLFLFVVIGLYLLFDYLINSSHEVPQCSTTQTLEAHSKSK